MFRLPQVTVVLCDSGSAVGSALSHRLSGEGGEVRCSPVLDSWDGLSEVCRGADVVYLLSALDLPPTPGDSSLQHFRTGVTRVLECCQESGVGSLVFTSCSTVVWFGRGLRLADENLPYVTRRHGEGDRAVQIAMAEAEVLKMSGTHNLGGSSCLYTCALRPAGVYGTGQDRPLHRALSWVGWGLNRLAVGPKSLKSDMVHTDNLVEAHVLAAVKLMNGAAVAPAGKSGWSTRIPACSGQAYFVTDGQPCNPQAFMDDVLEGLDFPTSKILRLPIVVALATAWLAELACKAGVPGEPVWTRKEVRRLTQDRTISIDRARADLGYTPIIDPDTAMRKTVHSLKDAGRGRHTLLTPALGYWICIPLGLWLIAIAAFESLCPAFLAPVQRGALAIALFCFRRLWAVRSVAIAAFVVHVLEGLYAFNKARKAGHYDTAPLWLLQTVILGFPSTILVNQLLS